MIDFATIDMETYYDKDFSLSKLQTDAYCLDPQFEIIGVSVKPAADKGIVWFSGTKEQTKEFLQDTIPWESAAVCAHNTLFDGFISTRVLGLKPKLWMDTLGMSRAAFPWLKSHALARIAEFMGIGQKGTEVVNALGKHRADFTPAELERYAEYCKNDTALTHTIAALLLERTSMLELKGIDMVIRMFTEPRLVGDTNALIKYYGGEVARKEALLAQASADRSIIMSNDKLAGALVELGVVVPKKLSATTGKETYAFAKTDKAFTALLEDPDPQVQNLVAARLGVKTTIAETRALKFVESAQRGPLPVYLNYWGAKTTGRLSGGNKINWQNLPGRSDTAIRDAILAPPGHKIVVGDSSNIELRVAMALAGQMDALEKITDGVDLYCDFATKLFGREITKTDKVERMLGKIAMLSLQYGAGAFKFQEMVRIQAKMFIEVSEAERIVTLYRTVHRKIQELWWHCNNKVLPAIAQNSLLTAVDVNGWFLTTENGFSLPGHPGVCYHELKRGMDGEWSYSTGKERVKIYGGKVVENLCIAGDTLVLTDTGWMPLKNVHNERVHDGEKFVSHGGKVYKGVKSCVVVDGVYMTPDHEVLTNEGWKPALEKPEPYRPDIRGVNSDTAGSLRREEDALAIPMPMRGAHGKGGRRSNQGSETRWDTELWVSVNSANLREEYKARDGEAPRICCLAVDVGPVPSTNAPSMEKLRSAWHTGVQVVGEFIHSFLVGYGRYIPARVGFGQNRQQRSVFARELPVDNAKTELPKQTEQLRNRYSITIGRDGYSQIDSGVSTETGATPHSSSRQEESYAVYDLMDCGDLNRFVVLGDKGPFIVHNCQHAARHIVMWQTGRIHERFPVSLSVHDEVVCVVPDEQVDACVSHMTESLSLAPKWCRGAIPLACEVGVGESYGAAKH